MRYEHIEDVLIAARARKLTLNSFCYTRQGYRCNFRSVPTKDPYDSRRTPVFYKVAIHDDPLVAVRMAYRNARKGL